MFFEHVRAKFGEESSCCHVMKNHTAPGQSLCKALEGTTLFIEGPVSPEQNVTLRTAAANLVPFPWELFNSVHEYVPLIQKRLIDYRIHFTNRGLSPARKVQALCEFFGVRTAWHGPGDALSYCHAAQLAAGIEQL